MATEANLRDVARRVDRAFREFSQVHHWPESQYRLFLHFNEDWYTAHVIVVAEKFGGGEIRDQATIVSKFLDEKKSYITENLNSFNLTLMTPSQIHQGGIYEIGPEFVDVEELLAGKPVA